MLETIICMYVTLMAPIIAGVLNMIWCKLPVLKRLKVPIDLNKNFIDGKRIFGDNKTFKGLVGYIFLNILTSIGWGSLCELVKIEKYNYLYMNHANTFSYNLLLGILLGLGYALFELPNSFLKRRLDIEPGKTITGAKKVFFIFLDQADSVLGCVLVVAVFYKMTIPFYFMYVLIGAITHLVINVLLYFLKLRKNMF